MPHDSIIFTSAHRNIFQALSSDSNPLHCDPNYAKRTPFGEVILHGMAAVVYALGKLAHEQSIRLKSIHGQFRKPVLLGKSYCLKLDHSDTGSTSIVMTRECEVIMRLRVEWLSWSPDREASDNDRDFEFRALDTALDLAKPPSATGYMRYCLAVEDVEEFAHIFSLDASFIPLDQLSGLLWSSYHIGMIWPGQQALFSGFALDFSDEPTNRSCLTFDKLEMAFDSRFDLASVTAHCDGVMDLDIKALMRPPAVSYSSSEVANAARRVTSKLQGQRAVVIGGSRGFGSIVALMLAHLGANVTVLSRTNTAQVESYFAGMLRSKERITVIQGDAAEPQSYSELLATMSDEQAKIDILVCSASPPIVDTSFIGMAPTEFLSYVATSLSLYQTPLFSLNDALDDRATIVNVSSVYVDDVHPGFSHYVAAKSAIEGMTRALAAEYSDRSFVIFRAPRMLTDQTNVNNDPEKKKSAIDVAMSLVDAIGKRNNLGSPDSTQERSNLFLVRAD